MQLKKFGFLFLLFIGCYSYGQNRKDSVLVADTTMLAYDDIFTELDALLDSINTPKSFTLVDISLGNGTYNYLAKSGTLTETKRKLTYAPSIGYFDKGGLGLSAGALLVKDGSFNPYQYSLTGSYDYLKKRPFITGISLTHYFTKDNLSFYTSPLQNELYGYFVMRKIWFKPSVAMSYGWGSRNALEEREEIIENIQLAENGFTRINTKEKIIDFNLIASIRHDFYFLDLFSHSDFFKLTPQLSFTSGTQQFGFNQTSNTYGTMRRTGRSVLYSTDNVSLDNQLYFQPLSLTAYIKTEYVKGKFFIQPQMMFDYYFPATTDKFTTSFIINTGMVF